MNILIIDNDDSFINKLQNDLFQYFCNDYEKVTFIYDLSSLESIHHLHYAFIDINLPQTNGILIAKEIKEKFPKIILVFISSHSHLVHTTLIVNPFYFIRKSHYQKDLHTFFVLIKNEISKKEIIDLSYNMEKQRLFINDIVYIESQIHKLLIHTQDQVYYDNRSLKKFLQLLPKNDFVQIHKSYIININYLTLIKSNQVFLNHSLSLSIGRAYKEDFQNFYMDYLLK